MSTGVIALYLGAYTYLYCCIILAIPFYWSLLNHLYDCGVSVDSRIIQGDILRFAYHYHGEKFHALLCDPPYELGFMGRDWDRSGIAFNPDTWAALAEHLYPGAFGMAFASSRGWHRLAVAIEDAGMAIHPSIFGWCQGSGFPKATRVKDAPAFEGHRYGLQMLKPALEPIIVFQKPYTGKPAECIARTGAGALNIEGGRIMGRMDGTWGARQLSSIGYHGTEPTDYRTQRPAGRWPANFYLSHLPACNGSCAPGCPVAELGGQSGESASARADRGKGIDGPTFKNKNGTGHGERGYTDSGTAARFFFNADWALDVAEQLATADPVRYVAKASRRERDAGLARRNPHPTIKPIALARWLATLLLPPIAHAPRRIMIPFAGSGSECIGAVLAGWDSVLGIEREREYIDIAKARFIYHMANTYQLELGNG